MKSYDFSALDGRLLRTFLVMLDASSVSRAADRLRVTQSAVSPALARLRRILGDPLFVRTGQARTPTETALALMAPVPFEADPVTVCMVWHERSTSDPAHRWLRESVREICAQYA